MNDLEAVYQKNPTIGRRALSQLTGVGEKKCRKFLEQKRKGLKVQNITTKEKNDTITKENFTEALIHLARHDVDRLNQISEKEFRDKTNSQDAVFDYSNIHKEAVQRIHDSGFCYPEEMIINPDSKVLVIGDSHGKHTRTKLFNMLFNLDKHENFDYIIHTGHALDDDNFLSFHFHKLGSKLIIVAKPEELAMITRILKENNSTAKVVREKVVIGDFDILNQEFISDYTKTYISNLDQHIFKRSTITNSHRHEIASRCTSKYNISISSCGCLCEPHVVKTIKQVDYTDGMQVKLTKPDSYIKYRRAKQMYDFWEMGMMALENQTLIPCRIKKNSNGDYETCYIDTVYGESTVEMPAKRIFVNADIHADMHDSNALSIQEQFVKFYKPDVFVNLGDTLSVETLNPHILSQCAPPTKSIIEEQAKHTRLLEKMSKWAKEKHILFANHEYFMTRFAKKYPSMNQLFSTMFYYPAEKYNFNVVGFKNILTIDNVNFVHGDMICMGQSGSSGIEKIAKTVGTDTLSGHSHMSAIRFGCYSVGCSCDLNQQYNEVMASRWVTGFALVNISNSGLPFITNISFDSTKGLTIRNKKFVAYDQEFIDFTTYKTIIDFKFY